MSQVYPTRIQVNRERREVIVNWNDGHHSVYSFTLLRHACPCAECAGGHENMGRGPDPAIFSLPPEDTPATRLVSLDLVGNYGFSPVWEDGHHAGIYQWAYLRALCPCETCRREAQNETR